MKQISTLTERLFKISGSLWLLIVILFCGLSCINTEAKAKDGIDIIVENHPERPVCKATAAVLPTLKKIDGFGLGRIKPFKFNEVNKKFQQFGLLYFYTMRSVPRDILLADGQILYSGFDYFFIDITNSDREYFIQWISNDLGRAGSGDLLRIHDKNLLNYPDPIAVKELYDHLFIKFGFTLGDGGVTIVGKVSDQQSSKGPLHIEGSIFSANYYIFPFFFSEKNYLLLVSNQQMNGEFRFIVTELKEDKSILTHCYF